jgi:hypothetical protein
MRTRTATWLQIMVTLALVASACTSTYQPRPGPRVSMVLISGQPHLQRSGRLYPISLTGPELGAAVADNPRALAHMQTYQQLSTQGLVAGLGGAVLMVVGPSIALATSLDDRGSISDAGAGAALGTFAAGVTLYVLGMGWIMQGQPHLYDAINVYNDDLELAPRAEYPALPAPATASAW